MALDNHDEGADIFWPGYVDAVTNLVLNLLFMLTIMIVAVFMFALELSRHKNDVPAPVPESKQETASADIAQVVKDKDSEIEDLQKQLELLKKQAVTSKQTVASNELRSTQKVVIIKTPLQTPESGLENAPQSGGGVLVHFTQGAVTLSEAESVTLREALVQIAAKGAAHIEVSAPAGFSEAKRLGFYRAMAVRNQLIKMKVPADKIEVSVLEGKPSADNAKVLVSSQ